MYIETKRENYNLLQTNKQQWLLQIKSRKSYVGSLVFDERT